MSLDSAIWGPHYWFFLHTIALSYPIRPNTPTKKKYYEFIQNIPLFIPVKSMSTDFSKLLDEYPVVPYLDSRDSFIRWIHFIHNKINAKLEKPQISLSQFYENYYNEYKPSTVKIREANVWKERVVYFCILFVIIGITAYLYNK
jgi:hypothetical protein